EATRREGITAELNRTEATLTERKLALLELERELLTAQGGLKDREEARVAAEHQVVLLRERATGLGLRAEEAEHEAARMRERLERASEIEGAQATGEERRRELDESLTGARGELAASEDAIRAVEARMHVADGSLSRLRQESAAADSRLRTLLELKANFEGVSE